MLGPYYTEGEGILLKVAYGSITRMYNYSKGSHRKQRCKEKDVTLEQKLENKDQN